MIDIKDTSNVTRFSTPINEGSKRKFLLMKEDYITLKFSLEKAVYFKLGDYVDIPNDYTGLFEVCDTQKPTFNNSTGGYDYELRLDAYYWKWKNKKFKFTPETGGQEASWSLTASLDVQLGVFLKNLQALGYKYRGKNFEFSIDGTVENKSIPMNYDKTNLLDALSAMAESWECEWWITNSVIHFGRCEYGTPVDFELGKNVETMTRSDSQTNFATRIYAFGSTRNISTNYRPVDESVVVNGITQKRLMLPVGTPYIDAYPNISTEEAVEDIVVFEDVYPRRTGTVSDITTHEYTEITKEDGKPDVVKKWNAYRFKDTGITFSEKYVLKDQELKIIFQSGSLNGMEFAVTFNPCDKEGGEKAIPEKNEDGTWNPLAQVWEIVRNEDYGRPLPDDVLRPQVERMEGNVLVPADTYILSGFDTKFVSDAMIPSAEKELKEKAEKYVEKSKIDPSTYDNKMLSDCMVDDKGNLKMFEVGDKVNLINEAYFETGSRQSRIIGFEYNLDIPYDSPVYTVGETASYSRIGEIENKVDSLTFKGQTYTGVGGSGVYVIGTNDNTPASNRNVLSALRSRLENLSRQTDDEASGLIKFLQGIISLGDIVAKSGITIGENGSGISVLPDGKSQAVVDYLYVKVKAIFDELEVKKKTYVGGEQILSPAGMKCIKVEELPDAYRCFFKAEEDGVEIENQFTVGTFAISQECNIKVGVSHNVGNRYYWRQVTAVGADYIDLSKTKCDPNIENDIPAAGDDIVALGHDTDITRQGAIVLSSVNEVAPSILMYQGINSFTLAGKEVIGFDYGKATGKARMRVYGDAYIGAKDRSTYIEYTEDGLEVKAKRIFLGTGDTLDDTLSDLNQSVSDINNQLDQSFQIWQGETADTPTLTNEPASNWKTDADKSLHVNDFYITTEGLCYQFELASNLYQWKPVTDKYLIAYVQQIGEKKRVFVDRPADKVAYDIGDCWVNATYAGLYKNDRLVCVTAKAAGAAFNISHWQKDSKYTDDTKAEESFDYTDTKVLELQKYADKSAQVKADAAAVLAKAYADGIVSTSEADAIDAANRYAKAQDELLKIATDAYADGVVSEEEKRAILDAQAKADAAKKEAQEYADKMDAEAAKKLLNTGIDIEKNTITATADKFTVQGRDGKKYAAFEVDSDTGLPMMKADYIKVTSKLMADAIEADGLNIGDKFVVSIISGNAVVKLTGEIYADKGVFNGTVNATEGQIAGFKISGNSLTNAGFDNDAAVVFRNDGDGKFSGIGGNLFPSELGGISTVARFENGKVAPDQFDPENVAVYASASGSGNDNIALLVGKGRVDIPGLLLGASVSINNNTINATYMYGKWKSGWEISYSDGSFCIKHNLGHTHYFVNANTAGDTDSFCSVHSLFANSFRITVYSSAGNRRNDNGFMFSVMGDKY